ncbi:hypothetical protein [Aestuariivirga sp.]|uniref:hypothetical protein n=1 Tax=Aestuariivirga sp. TaxID=2650926 RepID=UPI0039E3C462
MAVLLPEIIKRGIRAKLANAAAAARLTPPHSPSAALYFADPLAGFIGTRLDNSGRPIRRVTRTMFVSGRCAIIIRYVGDRELGILERRKFVRVYLVIDDNFGALDPQDGLPPDYRQRLLAYRDGFMRRLMPFVTHVVAPSDDILSHYKNKIRLRLDPAQCHGAGGLAHHRRPRGLDIVVAATRSHLQDVAFVADAVADFLKARPDARLTTFLNGHAPRVLRNLPNAEHLPMLGWERYRAFVAENRFHIALAPALDTAFNRARSFSRVHDHAAYGAAGLYSQQPPFSGVVTHGQSGLLLHNDPQRWRDALQTLSEGHDNAERLAAGGQNLSRRIGSRARVRNFWLRELELAAFVPET